MINASLDDDQAIELVVIDLTDKSSIADAMVIASGRSERHVRSMAENLVERLSKAGRRGRIEGIPKCDWVLVDAGDVVVHLFKPDIRTFYNLEKMWSANFSAKQVEAAGARR